MCNPPTPPSFPFNQTTRNIWIENTGLRTRPSPAWMRPTMLGSDCALGHPAVTPTEPCTSPRSHPPHPVFPSSLSPRRNMRVCCVAELSGDVQRVQLPFFQRRRDTRATHVFPGRPLLFPLRLRSGPVDFPIWCDFIRLACFSPSCGIRDRWRLNSELGTSPPRRVRANQQRRCSSNFCFL